MDTEIPFPCLLPRRTVSPPAPRTAQTVRREWWDSKRRRECLTVQTILRGNLFPRPDLDKLIRNYTNRLKHFFSFSFLILIIIIATTTLGFGTGNTLRPFGVLLLPLSRHRWTRDPSDGSRSTPE